MTTEEDIETDARCGSCGERLKIRNYPGTNIYRATCGSPVACQTAVYETTKEWLISEFCKPYESTGRPAPRRRVPQEAR
ncbi:hypothetical protein [Haloplanus salinus]|uniref:hypothetical protein n=1 Tax=Haloplanus salinus TaxID=1126245 RepID=UPI0015F10AC8|nr:hypothetical protein [Haloplanus salinus]